MLLAGIALCVLAGIAWYHLVLWATRRLIARRVMEDAVVDRMAANLGFRRMPGETSAEMRARIRETLSERRR